MTKRLRSFRAAPLLLREGRSLVSSHVAYAVGDNRLIRR